MLEGLRGEKSVAQISRERNITDSLYYKWRDAFWEAAPQIFADKHARGMEDNAARIAELERLVGCLTMELEIAKKPRACWDRPGKETGDQLR